MHFTPCTARTRGQRRDKIKKLLAFIWQVCAIWSRLAFTLNYRPLNGSAMNLMYFIIERGVGEFFFFILQRSWIQSILKRIESFSNEIKDYLNKVILFIFVQSTRTTRKYNIALRLALCAQPTILYIGSEQRCGGLRNAPTTINTREALYPHSKTLLLLYFADPPPSSLSMEM